MRNKINHLHRIYDVFEKWTPSDLAFINELHYYLNVETVQWCLQISGLFQDRNLHNTWPHMQEPFFEIKMCFHNIKNFQLQEITSNPLQVMGFDIIDVSERSWEKINFEIEDYEDERIKFFCEKVDIISIEKNLKFIL